MRFIRDLMIFLAGASFFHGISHIVIEYMGMLPLHTKYVVLTHELNLYAIVGSFVLMLIFMMIAKKLKK